MIGKNFIYIHIPKTGGSSIRGSLTERNDVRYFDVNDFKKNVKDHFLFNTYNKQNNNYFIANMIKHNHIPIPFLKQNLIDEKKLIFSFVRNPFARAASLYYEVQNSLIKDIKKDLKLNEIFTFEEFLDSIDQNKHFFCMPMIDFIGKENLEKLNFFGKVENFNSSILILNKKLKISIKENNLNKNNFLYRIFKKNYSNLFNDKNNIRFIKKIYKEDLDYFNYNFDDFMKNEKKKISLFNIIKEKITKKYLNKFILR